MTEKFLTRSYGKKSTDALRAHYDAWADSYDAETTENGYATPARCAAALAATGLAKTAAILDLGCGTGLSGAALATEGFSVIDGTDLSAGMLEKAEQRGLYRHLFAGQPDGPLPQGPYQAICAVGVISPGAAPASMLATALDLLPPGGYLVMSLNDHGLADAAYTGAIAELTASGAAKTSFEEHGAHLPGINLNSTVYVFEKT
jgi:predicted TPR repeat methyltransferase